MMTTHKCEELIEFSLGSLPGASFGAVLEAVAEETPITDQVPLGWLLTVTSTFQREQGTERGQEKHLKGKTKGFGCSAILAYRKQNLTSALP